MVRTPDRFPGEREDEGILLDNGALVPTVNGEIRYVTGTGFRFYEEGVVKGLTGTGISEAQHKTLRQLIHLTEEGGPWEGFASGAYQEILPAADPFPTSVIWWTSAAKTHKIVELTTTYNTNKTVNTEQWKVYDVDGSTVLATATDTWAYSGVFALSRTRVLT